MTSAECERCRTKDEEITYLKALVALSSVKAHCADSSAPSKERTEIVTIMQRQALLQNQLLLIRADVQYLNREVQDLLAWISRVISVFLSCCGRLSEATAAAVVDSATKVGANVSRIVGK